MKRPSFWPGSERRAQLVGFAEGLLWAIGVGGLLAAGWMWLDGAWYQRRADADLRARWQQERGAIVESAGAGGERLPPELDAARRSRSRGDGESAWRPPAAGTPLARISVPRLGLEAVVAAGVDQRVLRRAVGHLPRSSLPGEDGNIVLAGHRDTFFRSLERIRDDDIVLIETAGGVDRYRVEWTAVVKPSRVDLVAATGYPALTLVTCFPFEYVGNAPFRFVLRARRLEDGEVAGRASSSG